MARESRKPISQFPIVESSILGIADTQTITVRLASIVRRAQSDFQFATIYEQRKTNAILIAGFQTLSDAIYGIGAQMVDAIADLAGTVDRMSSVLDSRLASLESNINDAISTTAKSTNDFHRSVVEIASNLQERHDRALEMLDNIQRKRKPDGTRLKDFWTNSV